MGMADPLCHDTADLSLVQPVREKPTHEKTVRLVGYHLVR